MRADSAAGVTVRRQRCCSQTGSAAGSAPARRHRAGLATPHAAPGCLRAPHPTAARLGFPPLGSCMQTVLITGANRGIGLALAQTLAARGDRIIAACRAPSETLTQTGARIEKRRGCDRRCGGGGSPGD